MVFAAVGMGMLLMMLIAEGRWLRTAQPSLAPGQDLGQGDRCVVRHRHRLRDGLSCKLGLLWPRFMACAGPLIGTALVLETYAFFIEAIFLGLHLNARIKRSPPSYGHWGERLAATISSAPRSPFRALADRPTSPRSPYTS